MIYCDANATSRLRPEAKEAISSFIEQDELFRNPSSVHESGRRARALLNKSRKAVIELLFKTDMPVPAEVVFTSGGTEGCATLLHAFSSADSHIISSSIEHQAVLETLKFLETQGRSVTIITPAKEGVLDLSAITSALRSETALVMLQAANNVTGVVQPLREIIIALRAAGYQGVIASDATQAILKSALDFSELFTLGLDALVFSGHKLGAPAGIGGIVLKQDHEQCRLFTPMLHGGPQEMRFRAGTENLLGISALAAVARALTKSQNLERERMYALRERLWQQVKIGIEGVSRLTPTDGGDCLNALSNTLALYIEGVRADGLVVNLDLKGAAISTGSACSSGRQEASYVFTELGLRPEKAASSIRISLDWDVSERQVDTLTLYLAQAVRELRAVEEVYP